MRRASFALTSALTASFVVLLWSLPYAAQDTAPLTDQQIELFLKKGKVVKTRGAGKGITDSVRATVSDGTLTHDVHIQVIDERKSEFRTKQGLERDFRDSWEYNIAAYRLDRLLDLRIVPVSVQRNYNGRPAAFTWWVDDVLMDEGERLKKDVKPPDLTCWNQQVRVLRVFDQLIANTDRNLGNLLITTNWRLWGIDHTRAFRRGSEPASLGNLTQVDRTMLKKMKELTRDTLKKELGGYIGSPEISALLARRDAIVKLFESRGEVVLYDRQPPEQGCKA
jgi:hypothetical protein